MDTDAGLGVDPPLGSGLYALYRDREYISQRLMRSRYHAADTAALDGSRLQVLVETVRPGVFAFKLQTTTCSVTLDSN